MSEKTFLVWDVEGQPLKDFDEIVLWRHYKIPSSHHVYISIPEIIEDQADELRERYLAWLFEMGEALLPDKRLYDILEIRPGFSYWWMTLVSEKCNWEKSPHINHVFRLFVFEDILQIYAVKKVVLVSCNSNLIKVLKRLCQELNIVFEWKKGTTTHKKKTFRQRIGEKLPIFIKGGIFVSRYIWDRRSLIRKKDDLSILDKNGIIFVDYLINLDKDSLVSGSFSSNYWTKLPDIFKQSECRINWLHLYIPHVETPVPADAVSLINRFHEDATEKEYHSILDQCLSYTLIWKSLRDYVRLVTIHFRLRKRIKKIFRPSDSKLDLWSFYRKDWQDSFCGPAAMWNCLILNQFETFFTGIPRQKLGVYLQENQNWEMAFIHAWRSAGHGHLIGVPHSTVRFWDLRYYFDKRVYSNCTGQIVPKPDEVALNGPVALEHFINGGYPVDQIVEVEALRYLYLTNSITKSTNQNNVDCIFRILVCGDYVPGNTKKMMLSLSAVANFLPAGTRIIVKPHPSCIVDVKDYPSLSFEVNTSSLEQLFTQCDVVFTSNITSAAVDAYCVGLPVVTLLDGNILNMSPLRGLDGVNYVTSPDELLQALRHLPKKLDYEEHFFCLDKGVSRWRSVVQQYLEA